MQVLLAGFNIDKHLIDKLSDEIAATPEVISAAYARISRSSKSVTELRAEARKDVEKARQSNQNIVFEMGHSSVAEHAVFNFDIIGISRYLAEFIQRSRLASFTEKSQRYVTLDGDFVLPAEIEHSEYKTAFENLIAESFQLYQSLFVDLKKQKETEQIWNSKRDLEGAAKEDARYILPLCTKTQMGMTINARSFALLLRRLEAVPLNEAKELYHLLYNEVNVIAPSIVRYIKADELPNKNLPIHVEMKSRNGNYNEITLINCPKYPDDRVLTGMLFEQQGGDFQQALKEIVKLSKEQKHTLWNNFFAGIKPWHKMPRAFELVDFTFELTMSSSCYAQFKRHRLCTIIKSPYNTADGYVLPRSIKDATQVKFFYNHLKKLEQLSAKLQKINPVLSPYALSNAHRVRILVKMNLRELYHFVRLRSDEHAQWEIKELSEELRKIVKKHCPLSAQWLIGKSEMK